MDGPRFNPWLLQYFNGTVEDFGNYFNDFAQEDRRMKRARSESDLLNLDDFEEFS